MKNSILLIAGCAMVPLTSAASAQSGPQGGHVAVSIERFKIYPILQLALGVRFGGVRSAPAYVAPMAAPVEPVAAEAPATQTCADGR